ncbi:class I SAM-dependent methyltransferase [Aliifodinibius sp. S!AR15-10]|uniref:hypothetical protein n=1 Tax=Aliifodinibius sp. S!AR15-10 TaxID=2950437 RepID=UPI00285A6B76|nr:hypothetical protein [Aliifodinibius sp. S!AR15-10]MDR8393379.1 class I SAM-dependent methyltransferase [Aliifodinibius sp. S!AR15-10]
MIYEGIFRRPRIKTNKILAKFSHHFKGDVINVSGASDSDKQTNFWDYYFGDYDKGKRYKNYFKNCNSYTISNYPRDKTEYSINEDEMIFLDLEEEIDSSLENNFDVVFCHTVLEHVFDVFKAFQNLADLSNDIVIVVVPQFQVIHDYRRGYRDYWRFTPFSLDKLFEKNGLEVIYRETTNGISESMYLFYVGSKRPEKWEDIFEKEIVPPKDYLNPKNDGSQYTQLSRLHIKFDFLVRMILKKLKTFLK